MYLYLHPKLSTHFTTPKAAFQSLMGLDGASYRNLEGRQTQKVQFAKNIYFIKKHTGIGWREIFKNILQLRLPVLSAKNEWLAIKRLQEIGITTPTVFAFGHRGFNPAKQHSFVLLEAIEPSESLETLTRNWTIHPPSFKNKHELIKKVARIARTMHAAGVNHRDFYLCHFLLKETQATSPELYLIDLHRAQCRLKVPLRWLIKDLAGLYFSSKDCGLTQRDYWRFMRYYSNQSLKKVLSKERHFWDKVKQRGEQLYREHA